MLSACKRKVEESNNSLKTRFCKHAPTMYEKLCHIWNHLASKSHNDYILLFGDDVRLLDYGWPQK